MLTPINDILYNAIKETPEAPGQVYTLPEAVKKVRGVVYGTTQHNELIGAALGGDDLAMDSFRRLVEDILLNNGIAVANYNLRELAQEVAVHLIGYGPVQDYLKRPDVNEIMVNGPGRDVMVEQNSRIHRTNVKFSTEEQINTMIQHILYPLGLSVGEGTPYTYAKLPDGSRATVVVPPVSANGPTLTIRRFKEKTYSPEELLEDGYWTEEALAFIQAAVKGRANILISGGSSSGKTTLLKTIATHMLPLDERIFTLEDTPELHLESERPGSHVVSLLTVERPKNPVTMRDLFHIVLRERPDRIIVGEVRGAECADMLECARSGHDGVLATMHASSPAQAIQRLGAEVRKVDSSIDARVLYQEISESIDLVFQVVYFKHLDMRRLVQISEVEFCEDGHIRLRDIFKMPVRCSAQDRRLEYAGPISYMLAEKMEAYGATLKAEWVEQSC